MSRKKPWERPVPLTRQVNTREVKQTFLIVCEGEKTEPNYFRSFRVLTATVRVEGAGMNTLSLIKETIRLKEGSDTTKFGACSTKTIFRRRILMPLLN